MKSRQRQESGISLQNYKSDVQMALLSPSSIETKEETAERSILYQQQTAKSTGTDQLVANVIRNQKYSVLSFIPQILYTEFKYFSNLFYLLTALSQFIPILKVGLLFSFVSPLALVLVLTMLKQAYEDYQRFQRISKLTLLNTLLSSLNQKVMKKAADLVVGDILEVASGEDIPADCIFLASLTDKPSLFIKTDQLDGETDWKLRKSIFDSPSKIQNFRLDYTEPKINIYEFIGSVELNQQDKIGLSLQHTLWRTVRVASGKGLLMVIYTGRQTKLSLNSKSAQNKFGKLDEELNVLTKVLFLIMVILSLILVTIRGSYGEASQIFILFMKYFLLLSTIIPISMRVNLDFAKLVYKFLIDHDPLIPGCQCRNSNIPEELGRIQYILSDKTGTLTQNQMIFKRLFISQEQKYEADDCEAIRNILKNGIQPCEEIQPFFMPCRTQNHKVTDVISALMLCHNVTPVVQNGVDSLQGSSPDELTLVKFGQSLGYSLKQRTEDYVKLISPSKTIDEYQILDLFPFTSDSKSMGIIVKQKLTAKIIFYLKGADSVMESKIPQMDANFMNEACLDLANEGLRTLVISQRVLSQEYYSKWKKQFQAASASLKNREQKISECRKRLQNEMMFLGVTGVEDKLQEGVTQTIGSTRSIGIKVWMLTGDKIETAICVGRAVKLISGREEILFIIQGVKSKEQFLQKLSNFYKTMNISQEQLMRKDSINCVLVIDGSSLKFALSQIEQQFFNIAIRLPAIICSRVSPTQKAEIALLVKKYNKGDGRVLGIGDGGNDVSLIQSAHVGVGIYGKEGIQAALASDFSISKFQDLNSLIYWHGRLAYKRSSLLAQFIIHRGVIISIMQTIFIIEFYFVPLPIFNGFLLLGYSTIFTMLPVFSLIMDEDISRSLAIDYPLLYKSIQEGKEISITSFLYWLFISIYQGFIIMILINFLIGEQSFYMVNTVCFTCLILIEFLNVLTEIHKIHWAQIISIVASCVVYFLSIFLLKKSLNGVQLFTTGCLPATLIIVAVAWCPPFIYTQGKKIISPSQQEKMMKQGNLDSLP